MTNRLCTEPQARADLTVFGREFDFNDLVGSVIDSWGPATARVSLWAGSLLLFPIDEKVISIEACLLTSLPLMVPASWTHQIDLEVLLALNQQFGIHIAGIHTMLFWQQVFVLEGFMDERRSRVIGNRAEVVSTCVIR